MKILFFDWDGVLNTHEPLDQDVLCGQCHKDKVELLNRILRSTGAKIVLSSAWRYLILRKEVSLQGFDWLLRSHGVIKDRLIGHTRADTMREDCGKWDGKHWPVDNERGQQITDWLEDRWMWVSPKSRDSYAVIDDLDLGISAEGHPFVHVDGTFGLTENDADRAIAILNGEPEPREPCCECGEWYPRRDLLVGKHVFCESCRNKGY